MPYDWRKAKAIEAKNRQRWLDVNPNLDDKSGIYILTRTDENGFKYAYVGQAVHIMQRLCSHLVGFQHIDLSLKKHGLYNAQNPYGWKCGFLHYPESKLDEMEQHWIKEYANSGYQLRNKTSGSQGEGKSDIADTPTKGYVEGLHNGRENGIKELASFLSTWCIITPKKPSHKTYLQQAEKWKDVIKIE